MATQQNDHISMYLHQQSDHTKMITENDHARIFSNVSAKWSFIFKFTPKSRHVKMVVLLNVMSLTKIIKSGIYTKMIKDYYLGLLTLPGESGRRWPDIGKPLLACQKWYFRWNHGFWMVFMDSRARTPARSMVGSAVGGPIRDPVRAVGTWKWMIPSPPPYQRQLYSVLWSEVPGTDCPPAETRTCVPNYRSCT